MRIELTLVVSQRVQRNHFDVTPDGASQRRLIADDLPLPIVR